MSKKKPSVGQVLFSLNIGNAARYCEQKLTRKIVVSVGNKYFNVRDEGDNSGWSEVSYHIDGWSVKTGYSANSALYETEQEWEDERDAKSLGGVIYAAFPYGQNVKKVSLDNLRKIVELIGD